MGHLRFTATLAFVASFLAACSIADIGGGAVPDESELRSKKKATAVECSETAPRPTEDPETFPACACAKGGRARCVPKAKALSAIVSRLDTCGDGEGSVCVPDDLIKSGGAPKKCSSALGEGRCMSMCLPEVTKNAEILSRGKGDACDADERCVPCTNPLDNGGSTGVCEIEPAAAVQCAARPSAAKAGEPLAAAGLACPYTGPPLVDVKTFPACGDGMRCVPAALMPASAASQLRRCDQGLCAPEKAIAAGGQYLPKTCKSIGSVEGRCTNVNIPAVDAQKASLPQDICDSNERCAPCFDPLTGKETGACSTVSCDAPKQRAATFKSCCMQGGVARGKCVPKTLVPASQLGRLDDGDASCQGGAEVCAPNENLDPAFRPESCRGSSFLFDYDGVCISECVKLSSNERSAMDRGSCKSGYLCAPCQEPFGGSTGVSGCPGVP